MRLRSNSTSHKRSTRRRLRMAFAVALVTAPGMAFAAEELPGPLDHPQHREAGLLPYPFGATQQCHTSQQCETAKAPGELGRLIALIGLQRENLQRETTGQPWGISGSQTAPTTLNRASLQAVHLHPVPSQVVSASGTQSTGADDGETGGETVVLALPTLALPALASSSVLAAPLPAEISPSLPTLEPASTPQAQSSLSKSSLSQSPLSGSPLSGSLPSTVSQPALAEVAAQAGESSDGSDELAQSLIDIAIPLDMMSVPQPSQSSVVPIATRKSASSATLAVSPTAVTVPLDRQPELIQPAKSLSLTVRQPTSQSVNLSLTDTPNSTPSATTSAAGSAAPTYALSDASADNPHTPSRSVALHLSSASEIPIKAAPAPEGVTASENPRLPPRGSTMQVRIEGEPAPLLSGKFAQDMHPLAPAAPLPSMGRSAGNHTAARAEPYEPNNRVRAAFATRTSIVPDRDLERSMNTLGRDAEQTDKSLTIGLQESQTLSAQFVITELSVEHPSICQLMQISESSVSVVGIRPGTTRIALVMVNDTGERQVEVHEVSVTNAPAAAQSLPDMAAEISQAVGRLVPNSDVEVVAYEDYLLVHGFTHYESDAKKILSLVRKVSLVPVVDQLKSNER